MMQEVASIVQKLKQQGVVLWVDGDKLRYRMPERQNADEILDLLCLKKEKILKCLQSATEEMSVERIINREDGFPLSHEQQRLWFVSRYSKKGNIAYNETSALKLNGKLNILALRSSLTALVQRHEILRTFFFENEAGEVQQKILDPYEVSLKIEKVDSLEDALQFIQAENSKLFYLMNKFLIKFRLFQLSNFSHILLIKQHHIITDGWSMGVIYKELSIFYNHFVDKKFLDLTPLKIQYIDYVQWQKRQLNTDASQDKLNFWKAKLNHVSTMPSLIKNSLFGEVTMQSEQLSFTIPNEHVVELQRLSKQHKASIFMVLLTLLNILIYKYTSHNDIVVGSPVANRGLAELEDVLGFFVNTLPLRNYVSPNASFIDLLMAVKFSCLEAFERQDIPYDQIVNEVRRENEEGFEQLFKILFVLHNTKEIDTIHMSGLSISALNCERKYSDFDLVFSAHQAEEFFVDIIYKSALYTKEDIQYLADHFKILIQQVLLNPHNLIRKLEIISQKELEAYIKDWNNSDTDYYPCSITSKFGDIVSRYPDNLAVKFFENTITYRELDKRSTQLANYIQQEYLKYSSRKLSEDHIIAVYLPRGIDYVISLLAVLKIGAAFLPISTNTSVERINFFLEDADAKILLSAKKLNIKDPHKILNLFYDRHLFFSFSNKLINKSVFPGNLAYVIYTSGSTGQPKGVMIEHHSVCNMVFAHGDFCSIAPQSRILHFSAVNFEIAIAEILIVLLHGAALIIASEEERFSPEALVDLFEKERITMAMLPAAILSYLPEKEYPFLNTLLSGGEVVD